jgi:DNA topoisomerase-1
VLWRRVNRGSRRAACRAPRCASWSSASASGSRSSPPATGTSTPPAPPSPAFTATLVAVDGTKVATGKDFDDRRPAEERRRRGHEARAARLAAALAASAFAVRSVEEKPYRSSPKAAVHDLHPAAGGRPQAAPVGRAGHAAWPRACTSAATSPTCVPTTWPCQRRPSPPCAARCARLYGPEFVAARAAHSTTSKIKNAQEAHEAIRPTTPLRTPRSSGRRAERAGALAVPHGLAAHRRLADGGRRGHDGAVRSAPRPVDGASNDCEFAASGTTITFPGYRQVYVESAPTRRPTSPRRPEAAAACAHRRPRVCRRLARANSATPRRRRPATPRRRWSSGSRSSASAARRRGRRSCRRSRTAGTCGRRARRSSPPGPPSPSSG